MAELIIKPAVSGDTWKGLTLRINKNLLGAKITFTLLNKQATVATMSTEDGDIEILSTGAESVFIIKPFLVELPIGELTGRLRVVYADATAKKLFDIKWTITK